MDSTSSILRETPFRYADTRLLWPRLRLYTDHLELTGWSWSGRHERTIALSEIERLQWWSGVNCETNLTIHLKSGEELPLWVKGPGLWKFKIAEEAPDADEPAMPSAQVEMASAA